MIQYTVITFSRFSRSCLDRHLRPASSETLFPSTAVYTAVCTHACVHGRTRERGKPGNAAGSHLVHMYRIHTRVTVSADRAGMATASAGQRPMGIWRGPSMR